MHIEPMDESEGTFYSDWMPTQAENPDFRCRCGSNDVFYRIWTSGCGGFEDVHYRCAACGWTWWVEGPDS